MGSPHGSQLIRSVVLSRAPKSGDRGWQVLDKLVMLGVALSENKGQGSLLFPKTEFFIKAQFEV